MFESTATYPAAYVSDNVEPAEALRLALAWVADQSGVKPLILMHAKKMKGNDPQVAKIIDRHGLSVESPNSSAAGQHSAPVIAIWPSDAVIEHIDSRHRRTPAAVCLIKSSRPGAQDGWIAAHQAVDLVSGGAAERPTLADPVVEHAMRQAGNDINHNNMLVTQDDKAYVVRTLQELDRSGHTFDVEPLCSWALANGWPGDEVAELRKIAIRVKAGSKFVLRDTWGPKAGAARQWEAEVHNGAGGGA
ncbi:hypothetical protein CFI00_17965 [Nocardioides sp. S5]|uniref:hypothetical protein n=1 Tax=Nocardioides sp. S5 TaxID=2017486 RepID=UPI001A8D765A|nr:hypothetical protein [Nocardioides sp. S5]QSR32337.1 hypothetical protein CFI00_17965 [Nocardioides sp. S5]